MHPLLQRSLKAYRPLYLHGLLRDGQYQWPAATEPNDPNEPSASLRISRPCMLLLALAGLRHHLFSQRS